MRDSKQNNFLFPHLGQGLQMSSLIVSQNLVTKRDLSSELRKEECGRFPMQLINHQAYLAEMFSELLYFLMPFDSSQYPAAISSDKSRT